MTEEKNLITRAQNGDMNAFREIVEKHKRRIVYLAYDLTGNYHDAEDISQEVFIKMYRSIHTFRSESRLSTWLYRITVNTWIDLSRTEKYKMAKKNEPFEEEFLSSDRVLGEEEKDSPEKYAAVSHLQQHIRNALSDLSERERSVFVLRHYHELKFKEIAKTLHIANGTVKSLLSRAIKKLQHRLVMYSEDQKGNV